MEFVCQFDVREILGQGSFSEVKRCIDKRTRQAFAVKEITCDTEEQKERIEQEIQILRELNHHNILKLHHCYPAFDKYYLVMELACGGELFEDLVSRNAFSESTAREAMLQLFTAVEYIHGLRIVHRVCQSYFSFPPFISLNSFLNLLSRVYSDERPFKQQLSLQNIRPEKLILTWKSAESNNHFPPLKLGGFGLAKKLSGVRNKS